MKILMVEDSPFFGGVFRKQLEKKLDVTIDLAVSMENAGEMLSGVRGQYDAAILDFNLIDAPDGEIVPFIVGKNIPSIVFTANVTDEVRHFVLKHKVVDYILKSNASAMDYLAYLLDRLHKNRKVRILVVDDSSFFRKVIADLLKVHQIDVVVAENGKEAFAIVRNDPSLKMVITDYNMPVMDGIELTQKIRQKLPRNKLAIIGVSSEGDAVMAARFIKSGANDFIIKQSFLPEEFYCRVNQNLDALDYVLELRNAAERDYLTGLYNRRYFFSRGDQLLQLAQQEKRAVSCAMLDIDFFKKVNDTYGHQAGDIALQVVAETMTKKLQENALLARVGGEEFCVLLIDTDEQQSKYFFSGLCELIATTPIVFGEDSKSLQVTVSIGVIVSTTGSLDELIIEADQKLYIAKAEGRNRVVM
jgi:diguanylate cyclase (GGDEF)-like protein